MADRNVGVMHGDGHVSVLKGVPCATTWDCLAHRECVLKLSPAQARDLAADLLRCARYVDQSPALQRNRASDG